MNKSILIFTLALSTAFALIPFESYTSACGSNPNCYTLFTDDTNPLKDFYHAIERWPYINPYSDPSTNIGFAQSHAQALTYKLWMKETPSDPENPPIFSELSIIKAAQQEGYPGCQLPTKPGETHLPLNLPAEDVFVYLKPAFPDDTDSSNWCNSTFLNGIDLSNAVGYMFLGYDSKFMASRFGYERIKRDLKNKGIGIVSLKQDYAMANGFGAYLDGVYDMQGQAIFEYPANVVGVQEKSNGEVWLLVYAFGAHDRSTNYLWVNIEEIGYNDVITYMHPFAAISLR